MAAAPSFPTPHRPFPPPKTLPTPPSCRSGLYKSFHRRFCSLLACIGRSGSASPLSRVVLSSCLSLAREGAWLRFRHPREFCSFLSSFPCFFLCGETLAFMSCAPLVLSIP